ncbi:uncharacterized protein BP01DRAFT_146251 [Aspergillus saccharolyticus JOP 1030-1]|uniref:Uncharacterized protein n=1 Tax=Aspergillus saccharolyticus JOP 1030-1 TaxID=1450539 RepID=A0A318ZL91_9EURO|nr:hypothetical protein BP01DRAFT_146251 [Aspergillus saccharolyticus JOP 1030-1]PYH48359.1 hypothetical protein BP01DRAFT_146251 [Aspergillus saccharolyticus JOP 1030-1]
MRSRTSPSTLHAVPTLSPVLQPGRRMIGPGRNKVEVKILCQEARDRRPFVMKKLFKGAKWYIEMTFKNFSANEMRSAVKRPGRKRLALREKQISPKWEKKKKKKDPDHGISCISHVDHLRTSCHPEDEQTVALRVDDRRWVSCIIFIEAYWRES